MKHRRHPYAGHGTPHVAPHAGAWIETTLMLESTPLFYPVAPHAGAWIETCPLATLEKSSPRSPPTRGRGLKLS